MPELTMGMRSGDLQVAPMQRWAAWLLSLLLALAPVYWLPGVSRAHLRGFEWAIAVVAFALVFGKELSARRLPFPRGLLGPIGFAVLLALWIPGLVQAPSAGVAAGFVMDLGIHCATLWCFYCISRQGDLVWAVLVRAFIVIVVLAGMALVNELTGMAYWSSAGNWVGDFYGGLAVRGSAWSAGLALFMPVTALVVCAPSAPRSSKWTLLGSAGALVIAGNQFLSSGRSGLAASLTVLALLVSLRFSRQFGLLVVLALLVAGTAVCVGGSCTELLRPDDSLRSSDRVTVDDSAGEVVIACRADQLSTGRLSGWVLGAGKLADSPLTGHGHKQFLLENQDLYKIEIHNLWLRWAVYTGVLAPLWFALMAGTTLIAGYWIAGDRARPSLDRNGAAVLAMIIAAGLVMSLVEPRVPFGKNTSVIWWASAGALAGIADRCRSRSDERV